MAGKPENPHAFTRAPCFQGTQVTTAFLLLCSALLTGCGGGQESASAGSSGALEVASKSTAAAPAAQARVFVHPGAPLTRADLDTLKSYVEQGRGALEIRL